jgi:hypothetical protein
MENEVTCSCGQRLHVPDSLIGKKGRCPKCNAVIDFSAVGQSAGAPAAGTPAAGQPAAEQYYVPFSKPVGTYAGVAPPIGVPSVYPYTGTMVSRHRSLRSIGVACAVLLFVLAAFYLVYFMIMLAGPMSMGSSYATGYACGAGAAALMMVALLVTFGVWWLGMTRGAADLADAADECEKLAQRI